MTNSITVRIISFLADYLMYIDWGDGSGLQHVPVATIITHTYPTNGTYNVCLQLRMPDGTICDEVCKALKVDCNSCCKDVEEFKIRVASGFAHSINPDSCKLKVTPSELDTCYKVFWSWGDGTTDGPLAWNEPICHYYSQSGDYEVCMDVVEMNGDSICWEGRYCKEIKVECEDCNCDDIEKGITLTQTFNSADGCRYDFVLNDSLRACIEKLEWLLDGAVISNASSGTFGVAAGAHILTLNVVLITGEKCEIDLPINCEYCDCEKEQATKDATEILEEGYFGRSENDTCLYKVFSPLNLDCSRTAYINWGDGSGYEMIPSGTAIYHNYSENKTYKVCIEIRWSDGTVCGKYCKEIKIDCGCPDIVIASDTLKGEKIIEASDKIRAINQIEEGAKVRYTATNEVKLNAGFHAKAGAEVRINVGSIFLDCKDDEGILDDTETSLVKPIPTDKVLDYGKLETYLSIAPNPFRDRAIIEYFVPKEGKVKLILYHINGKVMDQIETTSDEKGWHQLNYQSSNIQPGAYYLILKTEQSLISKKVIIH